MSYQKGLVSIIVPVYNTDPILMKKCIESIIEQGYAKFEAIIINDGSSNDSTLRFLKAINDKRIRIIDTKNSGVSRARNLGLEKSCGEFVFFLDSDDYISHNTLGVLVSKIRKNDCIAIYEKVIRVNGREREPIYRGKAKELSVADDAEEIMANTLYFASQGALIRSEIAKKYRFDSKIKYGEDFQYMFKVIADGSIGITNECAYFYIQNKNSVLHKSDYESIENYLKDFNYIYSEILSRCPRLSGLSSAMMYEKINIALKKMYLQNHITVRDYCKYAKRMRQYALKKGSPKYLKKKSQKLLTILYLQKMYRVHYAIVRVMCILRRKIYDNIER